MTASKLALDGGTPAIREAIPDGMHGPTAIDDEEIAAVVEVLRSQRLFRFCENSQVQAFESEAGQMLGVRHALMVNSGTSALICALTGVGVGPGDEVIVPAYTYISTAAAVVGCGGVPVIAEIDESLGMDPADVERKITPSTKAILLVYMQGVPARIDALLDVAQRHGLKVVEDCCQCIGGLYRGRFVGTLGNAGAWSLNYYKIITTGEGGLVFTDEYEVYEKSAFASDPAMPMWMRNAGWESPPFSRQCYRPSEIMGALGRVQLRKMIDILGHTRKLKRTFLAELAPPRGYELQYVDDPEGDCGISAAILARDQEHARQYAEALRAEGLHSGTAYNDGFPDRHIYCYWDSILDKNSPHPSGYPWRDPAYKGNVEYSRDMCPRTLDILGRALRFRFHINMTERHAQQMAAAINKVDAVLGDG